MCCIRYINVNNFKLLNVDMFHLVLRKCAALTGKELKVIFICRVFSPYVCHSMPNFVELILKKEAHFADTFSTFIAYSKNHSQKSIHLILFSLHIQYSRQIAFSLIFGCWFCVCMYVYLSELG